MSYEFEIEHYTLKNYLGWTGPVGSDLRRRLRTLQFRARQSSGVRTGKLRLDVAIKERTVVDGLQGEVGNWHTRYAAAHHEGAKPHVIRPKNAASLAFRVHGRLVFAKRVNHPGNRPNPYLARWLKEAVR